MLAMLRSKVSRLLIVASLSTHGDGCIEVKFEIARRFDELFKLLDVFQLCIAIQKESGMVRSCFMVFVQFLQILN